MLSQCANPGCGAEFLYFREGRLFASPRRDPHRGPEFFWLCARCAEDMELKFSEHDHDPALIPRQVVASLHPHGACDI